MHRDRAYSGRVAKGEEMQGMSRGMDDLEAKATLNSDHIVQVVEDKTAESLRYTKAHSQGFERSFGQGARSDKSRCERGGTSESRSHAWSRAYPVIH